MNQLESQGLGVALAVTTAIGCLVYEKLVKNFSIGIVILLTVLFYIPLLIGVILYNKETFFSDVTKLIHDKTFLFYAFIYFLTWVTVPLWYVITRNQGVLVGSIYEVKYIVVLAIFYVFLGERTVTLYTALGVTCALMSIYFISK